MRLPPLQCPLGAFHTPLVYAGAMQDVATHNLLCSDKLQNLLLVLSCADRMEMQTLWHPLHRHSGQLQKRLHFYKLSPMLLGLVNWELLLGRRKEE